MSIILNVKGVRKDYGDAHILKGVSVSVEKGEFVSIMGPSGSGKSTLMYILNGLETPTEGIIEYQGKDFFNMSKYDRDIIRCRNMGFVFQFFNLVDNLTVEENIILPAIMCGKKQKEIKVQLEELLNLIGIDGKENCFPSQLSGGQQQRVSLARAIINKPDIIFADEPTGSLDSSSGETVMQLLKKFNKEYGTTIIQVTHDYEKALYGDRLINFLDGEIVSDLNVEDIKNEGK